MSVCAAGCCKVPAIVAAADIRIRHRLWSLYWLARMVHAHTIVELGVDTGDSTRVLLCAAEDCGARLHSFDIQGDALDVKTVTLDRGLPWPDAPWTCRKLSSVDAGLTWGGDVADLILVDTDHAYATARDEIGAWGRHVRRGGCMVFAGYWGPKAGVKTACDEFWAANIGVWSLETHDAFGGDAGLAILWRRG